MDRVKCIFRIAVVLFAGAFVMLTIQPLFFTSGQLQIDDQNTDPSLWVNEYYFLAAWRVWALSSIATVGWCLVASFFDDWDRTDRHYTYFKFVWGGFSLLSFVSVLWALFVLRESNQAVFFLAIMFVLDASWLFWWATAIATPGSLKSPIVPGSYFLRRLPGLK